MIKLLQFVGRRAELTPEQFHSRWRAGQAAFFADNPAARALVQRCELNLRLAEDYAREPHPAEMTGPSWDGVLVQWFEDLEDYQALQQLPAFQAFDARELTTCRAPASAAVLTHDADIIVDKPGARTSAGLKLLCILRRHPALERPAFFRHWREHHGGLFRDIPELNGPLLGYHQNHGLPVEDARYDGVTEQWFASLPEWLDSISVPANDTEVRPDVEYMLDPAGVEFILAAQPTVVVHA